MTARLLETPTSADALASGVRELHSLLDRLHATPVESAHASTGPAVVEVDRAIRRLEALKLKLLASADRSGLAHDSGFTGTEAWVATQTTTSRTTAARQVALARELAPEAGHDATAAALDEGLVSPAHAAVIVGASRDLPTGVTDEQRDAVEAVLVEKAQRYSPDQLRRMARRAVEAIEPDQAIVDAHENDLVRSEEEQVLAKASFSWHDNDDGITTGHFIVPTTKFGYLLKILDAMTAPRRMRDEASAQNRSFDWRHRRGVAFTELLEHLPTDHLHHKSAATLVVTIDLDTLTGALKAAHLDTGQTLSAGEARRLACSAAIIPAVLGTHSIPLDLGRETRLFSQAQRIAAGLHHDTCAAEGCARPYAWCELHHSQPWSRDGKTNLNQAVPLCHWHHQRIHDHTFVPTWQADGTISFQRRRPRRT